MNEKLRLKDGITEKDLEKYGFKNGVLTKFADEKNGIAELIYHIVVTRRNKNIQITTGSGFTIAASLQLIIYQLTVDGMVERVEVE